MTDWTTWDVDGARSHYMALAWTAFHALADAGFAVLANPEDGGAAVVHSSPPISEI